MNKFLSVNSLLISCNGIVLVVQTAENTTAITYANGLVLTLIHASETAPAAFTDIAAVIDKALATDWSKPVYDVVASDSVPAISAVVTTHVIVPTA